MLTFILAPWINESLYLPKIRRKWRKENQWEISREEEERGARFSKEHGFEQRDDGGSLTDCEENERSILRKICFIHRARQRRWKKALGISRVERGRELGFKHRNTGRNSFRRWRNSRERRRRRYNVYNLEREKRQLIFYILKKETSVEDFWQGRQVQEKSECARTWDAIWLSAVMHLIS